MAKKTTYRIIGLMSGTSLDGLDIACCEFTLHKKNWQYELLVAKTIHYPAAKKEWLSGLMNASALQLADADAEFGRFCGKSVKDFLLKNKIKADFIASHGHTIFHQPEKGFTTQIGNGAYIHAESGLPVVSDFRSLDVALGGQGAPLVPAGDKLLFSGYDYCLNLGGIANISLDKNKKRIAYDVCPANLMLNFIAARLGKAYDKGGDLAKKGKVNDTLLKKLNSLPFYLSKPPKSLGREWVEKNIFPLLKNTSTNNEDLLATCCEHIAMQIAHALPAGKPEAKLLITGGGALNHHLVKRIAFYTAKKATVVIPDKNTILFKEALVFAFLGLLRVENKVNSLASVTGSKQDNVGGAIYGMV